MISHFNPGDRCTISGTTSHGQVIRSEFVKIVQADDLVVVAELLCIGILDGTTLRFHPRSIRRDPHAEP